MISRKSYILFCLILSFLIVVSGRAQDPYKIMNWKTEATLRAWLLQEMNQQYDLRRTELASALETDVGIAGYREKCRSNYMKLIGDTPPFTPLRAKVMKRDPFKGYVIENVVFESRPGHHVTSSLYLPDGHGPFPAALIFCGHEMTSKATESYQKTAILFALNGFAALVVDPISQGERVQFTDSAGIRILRGSTTEHTLLNAGANLSGSNIVAWELFDNTRALDYLISRPEVDPDRIGCLGNSGGGAQTAYFIGFDDRIKVAAPCSNIASRERNYELAGAGDGCQQIPFEGREHLEIADFLIMFAPKPLLILAGRFDFVDYRGTETVYEELNDVYSTFGEPEKVKLFTYDDGHGISQPKREAAVTWFRKWLCADTVPVREGAISVRQEETTFCTSAGQVNSSFADEKNVQDFNMEAALELAEEREEFLGLNSPEEIRHKLRELLSLDDDRINIEAEKVSLEQHKNYSLGKYILRKRGEVPLPCLFFIPELITPEDTLVIWLNESGKSSIASDSLNILPQMRAGNPVILADLRGMGETAENPEANEWKYYNREYHNAIIALHIGQPLPGQRTGDVFTILEFVRGTGLISELPVKIIASGSAGPVAIYASVLDPRISEIEVTHSIRSYFEILDSPMERDWYSYVIPDILKYFDLPDLLKLRPETVVTYKEGL